MPVTLRLKWLHQSEETVKQMRWHKEGKCDSKDSDIICPIDSEAWEPLDHFAPKFAWNPRSVCLGLSTDGFHPHSEATSPYS